jgi:hypothetical protein
LQQLLPRRFQLLKQRDSLKIGRIERVSMPSTGGAAVSYRGQAMKCPTNRWCVRNERDETPQDNFNQSGRFDEHPCLQFRYPHVRIDRSAEF